jgi:hypothetical protein
MGRGVIAPRVARFKLHVREEHARIVPAAPFVGPGVDLRGDEARAAIARAAPLVEWLHAREPGVHVRSLSVDLATGRVLVTIDDGPARPRVVRVDAPQSAELLDAAAPLVAWLADVAAAKIAARQK